LTNFDEIWHSEVSRLPDSNSQKFKNLKIQDGSGRHFEKSKNRYISTMD